MQESPESGQQEMRGLRTLFILAIASSLSTLSMDFFAPSMPNAMRDLDTSPEAVKSMMILFLAGYGIGPFVWGILADRIGRRRVMLMGLGCYMLASAGCLVSAEIPAFSAFRVLQGIGAASGAVIARAMLRDIYGPEKATRAISNMLLILVWVPISAPLLGGLMSSWFDWRINFLVMAIVAGATLLASFVWLSETQPAHARSTVPALNRMREVLSDAVFLRHSLANMFCFTGLLLFLSNYSFLTEALYGFSTQQNGFVLTGFNVSISAGVYAVIVVVPRIGIKSSIRTGLWMALAGWFTLWLLSLAPTASLTLMAACVAFACLGSGLVFTLTIGEALTPFTTAAGTASALFMLIQSGAASGLNFALGNLVDMTLQNFTAALALCALLALAGYRMKTRAR